MNDTQKIAANTLVQLVGKAITVATSILVVVYLTRSLGVAGYGNYATVFAYLGVFGTVIDLGLFIVVVREIAKRPEEEETILDNMLGLKLSYSVLVLGAAYLLALGLPYSAIIRQGILLGAVSQLFISLNQVPLGSFQAALTMYKATISDVVGRLVLLGLVWWIAGHQGGLLPMILAVVITNVVIFSLNTIIIGRKYWLTPRFNLSKWRELFLAALPIGVVMILGGIYFRTGTLMLAAMQGSFAAGIYSAPYKILEVFLAIPSIFMSSVLPIITITLKRSAAETERVHQRAFNFSSLLALPLIAGTLVVATPVMIILTGPEFSLSGSVLRILIFILGCSFLNSVAIYTLMAADQQHRLVLPYIIAVVFNIIANLILIPRFSYWGAATVAVLTELWVLIASGYVVQKYLHLVARWRVFGKALLSSVVMGAALYYWRELSLEWLIVIGIGIYAVMIMATRAVRWTEIVELIPSFSKTKR